MSEPERKLLSYPQTIYGIKIRGNKAKLNWLRSSDICIEKDNIYTGLEFRREIVDDVWRSADCNGLRYVIFSVSKEKILWCSRQKLDLVTGAWKQEWIRNVGRWDKTESYCEMDAAVYLKTGGSRPDPEQERLRLELKHKRIKDEADRKATKRANIRREQMLRERRILEKWERAKPKFNGFAWVFNEKKISKEKALIARALIEAGWYKDKELELWMSPKTNKEE
jgi:hypothetical protein